MNGVFRYGIQTHRLSIRMTINGRKQRRRLNLSKLCATNELGGCGHCAEVPYRKGGTRGALVIPALPNSSKHVNYLTCEVRLAAICFHLTTYPP